MELKTIVEEMEKRLVMFAAMNKLEIEYRGGHGDAVNGYNVRFTIKHRIPPVASKPVKDEDFIGWKLRFGKQELVLKKVFPKKSMPFQFEDVITKRQRMMRRATFEKYKHTMYR